MKICFVGDINSIHVQKWIRYFANDRDKISIISTGYYPHAFFGKARVFSLPKFKFISQLHHLYRRSAFIRSLSIFGMGITSEAGSLLPNKIQKQLALKNIQKKVKAEYNFFKKVYELYHPQVKTIIQDIKPDIVQSLRLFPEGFLAAEYKYSQIGLFAWGQDICLFADTFPEIAELTSKSIKKCDFYFTDNYRDVKDAKRYGLTSQLTHITPSGGGVETDKLHRIKTLDSHNYKKPVFFTFRRMGNSFINNVAVVEALKILKDECAITAQFVICGYKSSPFYKLIKLKAKELGIFEQISVIPPFPYSHLAHVLSQYHYVVSAATHDGTTNALLETMWLGGIPLNGPYEPLDEWIEDGINGYLFDTNNPRSIAIKMYQCLQDEDKHESFKRINQEIIKKRADYNTCMDKVKEIYSIIVGPRNRK